MTTPLNENATLQELLFGDVPGTPTDALTESLHTHGTVRVLIPGVPALAAVEREVAKAINGLLSLNLVDLAADGWKDYEALREAAKRTRDAPKSQELVPMAKHEIDVVHHPFVELCIDGTSTKTIEMTLEITFTLVGLLAVVEQARLTAIRCGNCTVAGALTVAGVEVAKKQRKYDLPGAVRLRHGIALLEAASATRRVDKTPYMARNYR